MIVEVQKFLFEKSIIKTRNAAGSSKRKTIYSVEHLLSKVCSPRNVFSVTLPTNRVFLSALKHLKFFEIETDSIGLSVAMTSIISLFARQVFNVD